MAGEATGCARNAEATPELRTAAASATVSDMPCVDAMISGRQMFTDICTRSKISIQMSTDV